MSRVKESSAGGNFVYGCETKQESIVKSKRIVGGLNFLKDL